jgi:hypothetical protein
MAIKISGTTVITDNRELTNIESINQVLAKPTIFSPLDGETGTPALEVDVTIQGSGFNATIGNRQYRQFQVDLSTGDFSNPVVNELVNADSLTLAPKPTLRSEYVMPTSSDPCLHTPMWYLSQHPLTHLRYREPRSAVVSLWV